MLVATAAPRPATGSTGTLLRQLTGTGASAPSTSVLSVLRQSALAARSSEERDYAANEHRIVATWRSSMHEIKREYGRGIYMYFRYLTYLIGTNLLLASLAAACFGTAFSGILDLTSISLGFLAFYPPTDLVRQLWLGTTVGIFALAIALSIGYKCVYGMITRRWTGEDRVEEADEHSAMLEDVAVQRMTAAERRRRRLLSGFVLCVLITVQTVVTYYLHSALAGQGDSKYAPCSLRPTARRAATCRPPHDPQ